MTRLRYETVAGQASEADTYAQLIEYLRLAQEAAYLLGHLRRAQDDNLLGQGWIAIGEMLKLTQRNVTKLASRKMRDSTGWKQ